MGVVSRPYFSTCVRPVMYISPLPCACRLSVWQPGGVCWQWNNTYTVFEVI